MFNEDSIEARQNNEFEALQAIYGDDLRDLRKKAAWNKWTPLDLSVSLTPQQGGSGHREVHVKLDLHVKCTDRYPEMAPDILLENPKGMSHLTIEKLKKDLEKKTKEYEGSEMIFQLCQQVEEFLHLHNKPPSKSLYDEMLKQQKEKKKEEELQKQLKENRQRESMWKEVHKREDMLKAEARQIRDRHRSVSEMEAEEEGMQKKSSVSIRRTQNISTEPSEDHICDVHKGTVLLDFNGKKVQRSQCIKHNDTYNVIYRGMDMTSGELVEISQWSWDLRSFDVNQVIKHVCGIEQEINYLAKLRHKNLVHYFKLKQDRNKDHIVVYVLKEFICGSNCYSLFSRINIKVDVEQLRHLCKSILTAIDYIHRNNVVHKDFKETSVIINEKGVVKVNDYSIERRLFDIISSSSHGNYSKKTDIFDFGKFVLTMLGHPPSLSDEINIPSFIHSDLYDFLHKCLTNNEKERYTAIQLLSHQFFKKPSKHEPLQHVPHVVPIDRNISPEIPQTLLSSNSIGNGQSRITNEFEILEHLGKGAFGDVLKAKNKLDGGYYAIKRIKLNPKNKTLNKKIVREVMLLSRLNHENVVRYYNSWIETTTIKCDVDADSTTDSLQSSKKKDKAKRIDDFSLHQDIEKLAPPMNNVEISITFDSKSQAPYEESSEDDSSDEENAFMGPVGKFGRDYDSDSDSDIIEFERGSDEEDESSTNSDRTKSQTPQEIVRQEDYLYIQMEFCEKSTLRTAIDENLWQDQNRVWRLFREIVEGLAHIHQQGMIHRDLKPVNIFLDSYDHVKIGDFGLATTIAIRSKQGELGVSKSQAESIKEDIGDESKTGQVGTALYVAPEINSAAKAIYNQKVDIYSLGIILFEMCYKPLETGMERIKILTRLRLNDVLFPEGFAEANERAHYLVRWLLNHDISKRPTAQELLQSDYVPPPVMEERELQELVRHTLSNPQLKGYRYLISSCFKQTMTPAQDVTYDKDLLAPVASKPLTIAEFVRDTCEKVFKQHGGQNLATPLLMPKSKFYEEVEPCVKLMTHFGNVVSLPHDLRVPFARYIAWNNINSFRRYSVERVYKEKKVFGFIPREFYECAFDIVTPTKVNLLPDAELLYIVYEIINELPGVRNKHFLIKLNHTDLLKAVLLHCGLKDKHEELFRLLSDIKEGKVPKYQMLNYLSHRGLSDSMINSLLGYLHADIEVSKVENQFQTIIRKKSSESSQLAKVAIQELRNIIQNAQHFGVQFEFVISPGLVYNVQQFSGMICQFAGDLKKRKKHDHMDVIAAGGRYDTMISHYRGIMDRTSISKKDIQQSAVGISISLDKLVQAIQRQENEDLPRFDAQDVMVCSVGSKPLIKEKTMVLRSLWAAGIKCSLIEASTTVDLQDQLIELGVQQAIILKDNDQGQVRVRSWEIDSRESFNKFQEKIYAITELVENMARILRVRNDSLTESLNLSNSSLARSESKTSYLEKIDSEPVVDIFFVTTEKLSSNVRKRYDNQIRSQLDSLFRKLCGFISVVGVTVEANVIRTLASYLEFQSEKVFGKSVDNCISNHPRHKSSINEICDEIWDVKAKKTNPTIVLYSLSENFYKVIL